MSVHIYEGSKCKTTDSSMKTARWVMARHGFQDFSATGRYHHGTRLVRGNLVGYIVFLFYKPRLKLISRDHKRPARNQVYTDLNTQSELE